MGVIQADTRPALPEGPECPAELMNVYTAYRELKFQRLETAEGVVLFPRDQISWPDLDAFSRMTGANINPHSARLIMGLDAIFEGRNYG